MVFEEYAVGGAGLPAQCKVLKLGHRLSRRRQSYENLEAYMATSISLAGVSVFCECLIVPWQGRCEPCLCD